MHGGRVAPQSAPSVADAFDKKRKSVRESPQLGKLLEAYRSAVSPICHPLHGFESGGGLLRHWKWIGLRAPGPIIHHKGMHESSLGEPVLCIVVYREGMLMRQFVFDFDGHDLVKE